MQILARDSLSSVFSPCLLPDLLILFLSPRGPARFEEKACSIRHYPAETSGIGGLRCQDTRGEAGILEGNERRGLRVNEKTERGLGVEKSFRMREALLYSSGSLDLLPGSPLSSTLPLPP